MGASPRVGGCVALRVPESDSPARPPARSVEWAGTHGAPGGLNWLTSRKGSGRGQVNLIREATRDNCSKLGRGALASARGERDKQGDARESGRPPPPTQRGHCRSAPAPRPPVPRPASLPGLRAAGLAPAGVRSVGSSWAAPVPRLQRSEIPAQLTSPRQQQQRQRGPAAPAQTARLGSELELQLPQPLPAHPARPTARLSSGRPPAEARFAPTWPACPPSLGHCAHVRGRGHNPARIPSREGSGGARQPASERARLRDTPPRPPPPTPLSLPPAPGAARARGLRASQRRRAPAPAPHTHRAPGYTPPAARRQWALNKCPRESSRTCALEPDRVMTHPPPPPQNRNRRLPAPNQT